MNIQKLRSIFFKTLIGCLIAAASLAVVTVLVGQFNEVFGKALWTIILVGIHALISLGFLNNVEQKEGKEELRFFTNTTFVLIILSFITAVFGTWDILSGEIVGKLYATYFVLLFAVLHGEVLAKTLGNETRTDAIVYANYFFMFVFVMLLLPVIYVEDSINLLGEMYFRIMAAVGIIDATLTIVAVLLHKLYTQKHPKVATDVFNGIAAPGQANAQQQAPRRWNLFSILGVLFVGFIAVQFIGGLIFALTLAHTFGR